MKAWAATMALVVFFAVGGWYIWHGTTPAATTSPPAAVVVPNAAVQAARAARVNGALGLPRLMLIGNSMAYELAPSFQATRQVTVFDAAIVACAFPPDVAAGYRNPLTNAIAVSRPCHPPGETAELAAFRPDVVLWVVSDPPEPWTYRGKTLHACSEPYDSVYEDSLRHEIARMQRGGAKVVVTTEAYVRFTQPGDGVGVLALPDRTVDCNNSLRRRVAAQTHTQIVDPFGYTCPNGTCPVRTDGVVLRPGGLHYSGAGGALVARWILGQIH